MDTTGRSPKAWMQASSSVLRGTAFPSVDDPMVPLGDSSQLRRVQAPRAGERMAHLHTRRSEVNTCSHARPSRELYARRQDREDNSLSSCLWHKHGNTTCLAVACVVLPKHVCVCVCVCICLCIYTHTHTHTYTNSHAHQPPLISSTCSKVPHL